LLLPQKKEEKSNFDQIAIRALMKPELRLLKLADQPPRNTTEKEKENSILTFT